MGDRGSGAQICGGTASCGRALAELKQKSGKIKQKICAHRAPLNAEEEGVSTRLSRCKRRRLINARDPAANWA